MAQNMITLPKSDRQEVPTRVKWNGKCPVKAAVPIEWEAVEAIIAYCESRNLWRDYLMIAFMACAGFRHKELSNLKFSTIKLIYEDPNLESFLITQAKVKQRGRSKSREVFITPKLREMIHKWWQHGRPYTYEPGHYMFTGARGTKSFENVPMTVQGTNKRLKQIAANAGYDKVYSTHSNRKAYGRRLYDLLLENGELADTALLIVSNDLNHGSTAVTRLYIGLAEESASAARNLFT